ncbi:MAG: glycosyltransferase, partial [Aeromicrobium sp.]
VQDARLVLVGDGPNRRTVERLTKRFGVGGSVILTGGVPWDEVPSYTDVGDVFAMPCRTRLFGLEPEAFGIVFLEAQACGLTVLVGDSGGAPETFCAQTGRLIRGDVIESVSTAMVAALRGRGIEQPRRDARDWARRHRWSVSAEQLSEMLAESPKWIPVPQLRDAT